MPRKASSLNARIFVENLERHLTMMLDANEAAKRKGFPQGSLCLPPAYETMLRLHRLIAKGILDKAAKAKAAGNRKDIIR